LLKNRCKKFTKIIKETDKAWHLEMSGGRSQWFPKSKCFISDKIVHLPEWLDNKMIQEIPTGRGK